VADPLIARVAGALARGASVAIGLTKRCINRSLETGLDDAMENEAFALELSSRTADFKEGLRAFTERRPPDFLGR
jgi:2-(1,2-epoxy-1,2-dihydrophenyl)acetyl-CoA isomerase